MMIKDTFNESAEKVNPGLLARDNEQSNLVITRLN